MPLECQIYYTFLTISYTAHDVTSPTALSQAGKYVENGKKFIGKGEWIKNIGKNSRKRISNRVFPFFKQRKQIDRRFTA